MKKLTNQKIIAKQSIKGFRKLTAALNKRNKRYDELNADVEKRIAVLHCTIAVFAVCEV